MADIFISYAREEKQRVEPLAKAEARIAAHYGTISHAVRPD